MTTDATKAEKKKTCRGCDGSGVQKVVNPAGFIVCEECRGDGERRTRKKGRK